MTGDELERQWSSSFGDALPIADQLKWRFKERWFRIHTLARSKRYADDENEYNEILARHNLIVTDLIGNGNSYFVLTSGDSGESEPCRNAEIQRLGLQANFWKTLMVDESTS